jgi:hypothetical protein
MNSAIDPSTQMMTPSWPTTTTSVAPTLISEVSRSQLRGQGVSDVTISVRFSSDEIALVRGRAEAAGDRVTAYIRRAALEAEEPPPDRGVATTLLSEAERVAERLGEVLHLTARTPRAGQAPKKPVVSRRCGKEAAVTPLGTGPVKRRQRSGPGRRRRRRRTRSRRREWRRRTRARRVRQESVYGQVRDKQEGARHLTLSNLA